MPRSDQVVTRLCALKQTAIASWGDEGPFFEALLRATIYAHVPKIPPAAGVIRFIQFRRPDNGELAVPFFIERVEAERAAAGQFGVVAMGCRRFLELTRGANLVMDPTQQPMRLYPWEVDALLEGRSLPGMTKETVAEAETICLALPSVDIVPLACVLAAHFATHPEVESAYICEMKRGADFNERSLLLEIVVAEAKAERAAFSTSHAIGSELSSVPLPVLIRCMPTDIDIADGLDCRVQIYLRA